MLCHSLVSLMLQDHRLPQSIPLWIFCRYAMRPGCRRRQLLAHFGEKRGGCDPAVELPCDWCCDPKVAEYAMLGAL
jgi:RecQ zinc-binding